MKRSILPAIFYLLLTATVFAQTVEDLEQLSISKEERRVYALINDIRKDNDLSSLTWDSDLATLARAHSEDMLENNYFSHADRTGGVIKDRAMTAGYSDADATQMGENISRAIDFIDPSAAVVSGWHASPKHFENIVYPTYTHTGIGIAQSADLRTVYYTQVFQVKPQVNLLGARLGAAPVTTPATAVVTPTAAQATTNVTATGFVDVTEANEFSTYVTTLAERGVIKGQDSPAGKQFLGSQNVTREQLIAFLVRALELPVTSERAPFTDFSDATLRSEINAAYKHGIILGYADGTFHPLQPVTRAEAATLIARAFELTSDASLPFTDVALTSPLRSGIAALYGNSIIRGRTNTSFAPDELVTRFEAAKMISLALSL